MTLRFPENLQKTLNCHEMPFFKNRLLLSQDVPILQKCPHILNMFLLKARVMNLLNFKMWLKSETTGGSKQEV